MRFLGRQYLGTLSDEHHTELLLGLGWNGWMSHQMPQARRMLDAIAKDPDKLLVIIDPRRSETARRANLHLAPRPGSDGLLLKATIATILKEGWQDQAYIDAHAHGHGCFHEPPQHGGILPLLPAHDHLRHHIGRPDGNIIPGYLMPLGSHSDERDPPRPAHHGHGLSGHHEPSTPPTPMLCPRKS